MEPIAISALGSRFLGAGKSVSGAGEAGFGSRGSRFSRIYETLDVLRFMANFPLKSPQIRRNLSRVKRENYMSVTPGLKVISSSTVSSHLLANLIAREFNITAKSL